MIPIFRAKRLYSDEYVFGVPRQDSKAMYEMIIDVVEDDIPGVIQRYIEVNTLSIHFPFMIDNDKNKLFASLKGKKGASKVLIKFNEDFSNDCVTVDEGSFIECFIKFENGGLFFEEQDSTWYYLDDILNLDCEITEIGIEE